MRRHSAEGMELPRIAEMKTRRKTELELQQIAETKMQWSTELELQQK